MLENPFLHIWLTPRKTIHWVLQSHFRRETTLLICILGIGNVIARAAAESLGDQASVTAILIASLLVGPLAGLLTIWLWGTALRVTGKWLGGVADGKSLRTALAWGLVPSAVATLLWIPKLLIFGPELFLSETPWLNSHPMLPSLQAIFEGVEFLLWLESLILLSNTIAEVQGYSSVWRGFGNLMLALLLLLIIILGLVGIVMFWTGPL